MWTSVAPLFSEQGQAKKYHSESININFLSINDLFVKHTKLSETEFINSESELITIDSEFVNSESKPTKNES